MTIERINEILSNLDSQDFEFIRDQEDYYFISAFIAMYAWHKIRTPWNGVKSKQKQLERAITLKSYGELVTNAICKAPEEVADSKYTNIVTAAMLYQNKHKDERIRLDLTEKTGPMYLGFAQADRLFIS